MGFGCFTCCTGVPDAEPPRPPSGSKSSCGPSLRFGGYDPVTHAYRASVLLVLRTVAAHTPPVLHFGDVGSPPSSKTSVQAIKLDHHHGWDFWRYNLELKCGATQRMIEYSVDLPHNHPQLHRPHLHTHTESHRFLVPGANQRWRWGFHSCNGFDDEANELAAGGIQPLWKDVLNCHKQQPLHVMVGGGDQLYNDAVWEVETLRVWLERKNIDLRLEQPFSKEMDEEVSNAYFNSYWRHWSQPEFCDALATIPQIMTWDDHDIFDGWGSYKPGLQKCYVFHGVYRAARRFCLLFQQHSTLERIAADNGTFGSGESWNTITCLGPTTGLVMLDTRTERNYNQVIQESTWAMIKKGINDLPATVRHVIIIAAIPLVYPKIPVAAEAALAFLAGSESNNTGLVAMVQATGLAQSLVSRWGTLEIMDDLNDHWGADTHVKEKATMVHMLQDLAQARGFRFTFLSGDVHVAAVGHFQSNPPRDLNEDHRFMLQITSSAIGNLPPPDAVTKALNANAQIVQFDSETKECMDNVFGPNQVLRASRNWLLAMECPDVPGAPVTKNGGGESGSVADFERTDGALLFQFRLEHPAYKETGQPDVLEIVVPLLVKPTSK